MLQVMITSRFAYVQLYTGSVDTASSILIFEDAESTTTKDTTYVPLFETPTVDDATAALIEETCGNNSECAYDIAVTGNVDVGRETLDDIEEHIMILNQDLPSKLMNNSTAVYYYTILIVLLLSSYL